MGGTVAALYANSHPGKVQGMIFCAPMLAIKTKPFPVFVARLIAQGASRMGLEAFYVLGGGPYDPTKSFDRNDLTHSQARFCLNQKLIASASVNALGSPTYGWIDQAFAGMRLLGEDHGKLTMPVLLLQAGADTVVDNRPLVDFCAHLPVCTFVDLPGAKHEILMEEDSIRNRAITLIRNFLLSQTPVKHQQGEQGSSSIRERQP